MSDSILQACIDSYSEKHEPVTERLGSISVSSDYIETESLLQSRTNGERARAHDQNEVQADTNPKSGVIEGSVASVGSESTSISIEVSNSTAPAPETDKGDKLHHEDSPVHRPESTGTYIEKPSETIRSHQKPVKKLSRDSDNHVNVLLTYDQGLSGIDVTVMDTTTYTAMMGQQDHQKKRNNRENNVGLYGCSATDNYLTKEFEVCVGEIPEESHSLINYTTSQQPVTPVLQQADVSMVYSSHDAMTIIDSSNSMDTCVRAEACTTTSQFVPCHMQADYVSNSGQISPAMTHNLNNNTVEVSASTSQKGEHDNQLDNSNSTRLSRTTPQPGSMLPQVKDLVTIDNSSGIELSRTTPQVVNVSLQVKDTEQHNGSVMKKEDSNSFEPSKMTPQPVILGVLPQVKDHTKYDGKLMTIAKNPSNVEISRSALQPVLIAGMLPQTDSVQNIDKIMDIKDDFKHEGVSKTSLQPVFVAGILPQSEDIVCDNVSSVTDNSSCVEISTTIQHQPVGTSPQAKDPKQKNESVKTIDNFNGIELPKTTPQPVGVALQAKDPEQKDGLVKAIDNSSGIELPKTTPQPVGVVLQAKDPEQKDGLVKAIDNSSGIELSKTTPQPVDVLISSQAVVTKQDNGSVMKMDNSNGIELFKSTSQPVDVSTHVLKDTEQDSMSVMTHYNSNSIELSETTPQPLGVSPQPKDIKQENRSVMTIDHSNGTGLSETTPQHLGVAPQAKDTEEKDGLVKTIGDTNDVETTPPPADISPQVEDTEQDNGSVMTIDNAGFSKTTLQPVQAKETEQKDRLMKTLGKTNGSEVSKPQTKDTEQDSESVMTTDYSNGKTTPQPVGVAPQAKDTKQKDGLAKTIDNSNGIKLLETAPQPVNVSSQAEVTEQDYPNGIGFSKSAPFSVSVLPHVQAKGTERDDGLVKITDSANSVELTNDHNISTYTTEHESQTQRQTIDDLTGTQIISKSSGTMIFEFKSSAEIKEMELKAYIKRMNIHDYTNGQTPLHLASKNGLLKAVKVLVVEFDFNPNVRDTDYHETPLHYASQYGHVKIVEYFINKHCCDAEIKDMNDLTPLHYACRHGHLDIVKYLSDIQDQGCNLETKDNQQQTPLHYACHFGHIDIVKFLIGIKHCDAENLDEEMRTPLHIACKFRHSEIVHYLVHDKKCNPNAEDLKKRTPLHYACIWWFHIKYDYDKSVSHKVAEALLTDIRCDINKRTSDGDTALHLACKVDRLDIVRHLLSKPSCNPNTMNRGGQTPLQLTSHLNVIEELTKKGANPIFSIIYKCQKSGSDVRTPCLQSWSAEQVRELTQSVKTSQDLFRWIIGQVTEDQAIEVILFIIKHTSLDLNILFSNGYNALHIACKANKPNIVKCLLSQGNCNPNKKTSSGYTPLSLCSRSDLAVVKELLQHQAHSTNFLRSLISDREMKKNSCYLLDNMKYLTENARWEMDIALQLACEANQPKIVHFLLAERKCNPNSVNNAKRTLLQLTSDPEIIKSLLRYGANPMDVYRFHSNILGTKQPLCPSVKVFIVGNHSVGKSTLTAALQKEPFLEIPSIARKVSGVDEKTAGVIPYEFESKKYGRTTLYDFAGQREFYGSHAALLRNAIQSSPPIFLLVVNMNEENEKIKKNIIYWLSFIDNQCTSVVNKPHIIIIGSHVDVLQGQGEDPKEKNNIIDVALRKALLSSMTYVGFVPMNCCYSNSPGMRRLRSFMKESCSSVRSQAISFRVHCFQVYLLDKFRNDIAVPLKLIQKQIKSDVNDGTWHQGDHDITFTSFVPTDLDELCKFCKELNDQGHILFLDNPSHTEDGWIVIDKSLLLSEVTGTIFAPANFKEHRDLASSTGVVPLSKIKEHFPNHNPDMIVGYLSHLEFCHEISDASVLKLIYEQQICMQSERYFFFPALVTMKIPEKVWKAKPQQFRYHCGWILQCSKPDRFFTPRFLEVLLLRLAFSYALAKSPDEVDKNFPAIQRECSIWTNGMFWGNRLGPEILVEVYFNEAVIVLMRCEDIHLMKCIEYRPKVITKVLQCAKEFCPKVQAQEFFIEPSEVTQYPLVKKSLSELTLFSIQKIANIAISQTSLVHTTGSISLQYLLELEPYAVLNKEILKKLLKGPESKRVSDDTLSEISECGCGNSNFIKMFNPDPRPGLENSELNLYNALRKWRDGCEGTLLRLREKFDQYSIFAGRESDIFVSLL